MVSSFFRLITGRCISLNRVVSFLLGKNMFFSSRWLVVIRTFDGNICCKNCFFLVRDHLFFSIDNFCLPKIKSFRQRSSLLPKIISSCQRSLPFAKAHFLLPKVTSSCQRSLPLAKNPAQHGLFQSKGGGLHQHGEHEGEQERQHDGSKVQLGLERTHSKPLDPNRFTLLTAQAAVHGIVLISSAILAKTQSKTGSSSFSFQHY